MAFAASASFTIVFIFMDASAAILRPATRPPRAADECLGRCLAFSVIPVISEVPKVILCHRRRFDDDRPRGEG